ncbi:helix-turn-helix domain-containing protein [Noviherbaspirillum sp. CPCC 100848]|uniref:Helix-turn-helix domain-containing protein n=1 Tax=Noviherbaspirillum album TaxID=3080276 RepID=A0ABU6JAZ9_9BURK|nr:helix-turn-helix domain-containing protein [Noviherbaspirillum sp. CPCC 100848]MEC4720811.1 helix-turn-helix domain-containing protein [Noviherbaspirillum sp. CPCC 100848]
MEKSARSRRDEYTEATRLALLAAGREAFSQDGYQAAGIEAISRAARVTRGAFYHHFDDKKALFDAVVVAMQKEAADAIEQRAKAVPSVWDRLSAGVNAYLDACLDPAYRRIVIQEAAAVLGNTRYREIEETYPMSLLIATLNALKQRGELEFDDIDLLSRMVDAMICKLAIMLPDVQDSGKLRKDGQKIIASLLDVYRRPALRHPEPG